MAQIPEDNSSKYTDYLVRYFESGAEALFENGIYKYIKYANGDEIWLNHNGEEYFVVKIHTHDGLFFDYSNE